MYYALDLTHVLTRNNSKNYRTSSLHISRNAAPRLLEMQHSEQRSSRYLVPDSDSEW